MHKLKTGLTIVLLICIFALPAFARPVTMNLVFNIDNTGNVIHINGTSFNSSQNDEKTFMSLDRKFISSQNTGKVFGIVFAGSEFLGARFNTSYSGSNYLLSLTQETRENRFLIPFTSGTYSNIDARAEDAEMFGMVSKQFGNLIFTIPSVFPVYMRLDYSNIDLNGRIRFDQPTKLFIKSFDRIGNIRNVTIGVV